jgi:hypothetical protein
MNPTIIISKIDGQYLITDERTCYIRTKWEEASKFMNELLESQHPVPEERWPNQIPWVKEELDKLEEN